MKKSQFGVNQFTNPSGKIVWRVYGRKRNQDGQVQVIRENFANYEDFCKRSLPAVPNFFMPTGFTQNDATPCRRIKPRRRFGPSDWGD